MEGGDTVVEGGEKARVEASSERTREQRPMVPWAPTHGEADVWVSVVVVPCCSPLLTTETDSYSYTTLTPTALEGPGLGTPCGVGRACGSIKTYTRVCAAPHAMK